MLSYKGYHATLEIDTDNQVIYGLVQDMRGVIHFEGDTIPEAIQAFYDSVDDYLAFCEELGCAPEKPYSGRFSVRTSPEIHRCVSLVAASEGKSLNAFVESLLEKAAQPMQNRIKERVLGGQ